MYGMTLKELEAHKGITKGELLNHAAPLELSAHDFQSNLAKERLLADYQSGEEHAINVNSETAKHVRELIISQTGKRPEDLPLEPASIKVLKKWVAQSRRARLPSPDKKE